MIKKQLNLKTYQAVWFKKSQIQIKSNHILDMSNLHYQKKTLGLAQQISSNSILLIGTLFVIPFLGLGIRSLMIFNQSLLGKRLWRFEVGTNNLWHRVITTKSISFGCIKTSKMLFQHTKQHKTCNNRCAKPKKI